MKRKIKLKEKKIKRNLGPNFISLTSKVTSMILLQNKLLTDCDT